MVDESKLQTTIDEEDEEVAASESHSDNKGGNVIEQRPMVVSPPYLEPLVDKIKVEEELIDTWETFTKLEEPIIDGMKGTPGDDAFADLHRELSPKSKSTALEIRMDFKAPKHVEKKHVWGIDLLDTG